MATIQSLEEKVAKATEKVEKCKKTIERHEKAIVKKIVALSEIVGDKVKDLDKLKWNQNPKEGEDRGGRFYWEVCEIERKQEDLKGAKRKLEDAERILKNWIDKLNKEKGNEESISNKVPEVIINFLEDWKSMAYEWHIRRYNDYKVFSKKLNEEEEAFRLEIGIQKGFFASEAQRELLEEKGLDYESVKQRKLRFAGQTVLHMCTIHDKKERLAWLEKTLEQEKKAKLLDLLNRITGVVGNIIDASYLTVSGGNINGYIIGDKSKATINTFSAGGWAVQCFHYRTQVIEID